MIGVEGDRMTGQMIPEKLEEAILREISRGNKPFFVNATAGTTVMGSFDDQNAMNFICKKYGLWHHIDGCWGGFLAFSDKHKHLFSGIENADSVTFNPHKGLGVPQQSSFLLTNNRVGALRRSNTSGATYLFQDSEYSKYDIGDLTLSCGRKPDGLKLWLYLKRYGLDGMAKIADEAMEKSAYITKRIIEQPDKFEMINEPMGTNICFSYTPPCYRGREYSNEQKNRVISEINLLMIEQGTMMIQKNPLDEFGLPNFFRLTLKNERTTMDDMDYILDEIDRLGQLIEYQQDSYGKEEDADRNQQI
jgi:glutamate/tyrosine decarboxylase-like PLP-dependent enzyme